MPRSPFDPLADTYDEHFARTELGLALRRRVWAEVDRHFDTGARVLDLGCGSGEDALHLAERGCDVIAVDPSMAMVRHARRKASRAGLADRVLVVQAAIGDAPGGGLPLRDAGAARGPSLAMDDPSRRTDAAQPGLDGAIADFGVLNCVDDLPAAAAELGRVLRPGAILVAAVMPPACVWEVAWYLRAGAPRKALRRFERRGASADFGAGPLRVRYPSPRTLRRAFSPWFRQRSLAPLGLFLPPSYARPWLEERPRRWATLLRWEGRVQGRAIVAGFADHFLVTLERKDRR